MKVRTFAQARQSDTRPKGMEAARQVNPFLQQVGLFHTKR